MNVSLILTGKQETVEINKNSCNKNYPFNILTVSEPSGSSVDIFLSDKQLNNLELQIHAYRRSKGEHPDEQRALNYEYKQEVEGRAYEHV